MGSHNKHKEAATRPEITAILHEIRHYLPSQAPIKDFIHHNTIHMFQEHDLNFDQAIRQASYLYGSREYLPLAEYRKAYEDGKISDAALEYAIIHEKGEAHLLKHAMLHGDLPAVAKHPGFRAAGYLHSMIQQCGIVLEEQVHPLIYRLIANHLDQGIADISLSEYGVEFWISLHRQLEVARPFGISKRVAHAICDNEPDEIATAILAAILPATADTKVFLLEILMAARGWSGITAQIEDNPAALIYERKIKLIDYVALYLILLHECLDKARYDLNKLDLNNPNLNFFSTQPLPENESEKISRLWQEAMEMSFYFETLIAINANAPKERERFSRVKGAEFQSFFCIDDRECSTRRHLEELSDKIETFATPGFYAMDMVYQGPFDEIPVKQCPVPVIPKHKVRGVIRGKRNFPGSRHEMNFWHRHANNLFLGWIISLVFGLVSLVRLAFSVHFPTRTFATASSFANHDYETELKYERKGDEPQQGGYFEGYTVPEMAERVARVIRQVGLTDHFAPLIAIVGHGSSSTNNPYFAAYDCGACSGRSALVNARTFAMMANREDVRSLIKKAGISIPATSHFIGAIHDTARDEVLFLDEDRLPAELQAKLVQLKKLFSEALARNAHERVRRFMDVDFPRSPRTAVREARLRTEMLFEPRPEYNHATNALAIVGRRSLTEDIFLDRRAFHNSYDATQDHDGKILNGILTPLTPVCGGINLEYLFSRVDNVVFGAGSKLPQNVFSLIGVGNGVDGDLRTGLPEQMIEIHDPLRLLILVEQRKDIVLKVLEGNPGVMQWIEKDWVKFCIYDYAVKKFFWYSKGKFTELHLPKQSASVFTHSHAVYNKQRENIAPAVIRREA